MALSKLEQVRLQIGDVDTDEQYLDDDQVLFFLQDNANNVLDASIACLEVIIASIALSPSQLKVGAITEYAPEITALEARLTALKEKKAKGSGKVPFLVHSDRSNWDDIDSLYSNRIYPRFKY